MKAIETEYAGVRLRSRLEARWAVFFDALGIQWEYEPEGFELSDGTRYLPDFYLPNFSGGVYVEVKPEGDAFVKARAFAKESKHTMWLCAGWPDYRVTYVVGGCTDSDGKECDTPVLPLADQAEWDNRFYSCPGYENDNGRIPSHCLSCLGNTLLNAIAAARVYRFWNPPEARR